jgi:hypothetical protein
MVKDYGYDKPTPTPDDDSVVNVAEGDVQSAVQTGHHGAQGGQVTNVFHGTAAKVVQMGNVQGNLHV